MSKDSCFKLHMFWIAGFRALFLLALFRPFPVIIWTSMICRPPFALVVTRGFTLLTQKSTVFGLADQVFNVLLCDFHSLRDEVSMEIDLVGVLFHGLLQEFVLTRFHILVEHMVVLAES